MRNRLLVCCLPLIGLLTGCVAGERPAAVEKLLPNCTDLSVNSASAFSAERHYEEMVACVKNKQFAEASFHYARAGVQTWHDYLIRPDAASKERHQAQLRQYLAILADDEKQQFWSVLYATLRDPNARRQLCSRIAPVSVDTAAVILWNKAKVGYLHCEHSHMF